MPQAATPPQASTQAPWQDPYRNYNFKLEIGSATVGHFVECSNVGGRITVIQYCEGGDHPVVRKIPGRVEHADITLRYGLTASLDLWNWFQGVCDGNCERKNVSNVLLDSSGSKEVTRWNLYQAWPMEWNGAPLDARGKDVAVESITLTFEKMQRVNAS